MAAFGGGGAIYLDPPSSGPALPLGGGEDQKCPWRPSIAVFFHRHACPAFRLGLWPPKAPFLASLGPFICSKKKLDFSKYLDNEANQRKCAATKTTAQHPNPWDAVVVFLPTLHKAQVMAFLILALYWGHFGVGSRS